MHFNFRYRLGARAYKTAFAVFLTELITILLHRSSAFYGSIAAVICMMKSAEETKKKGVERLIGTSLGGLVGWGFLEIFVRLPYYREYLFALFAPLGVLVVIYLLNVANRKASCMIGCVVFLSIVVNFTRTLPEIPLYVINRVFDTAIGIFVATMVNALPIKEKKENQEV